MAWRAIPGYPDIEVSDDLQFRSIARVTAYMRPSGTVSIRKFPSRKLKIGWHHTAGYATVYASQLRRDICCHVLVCLAFNGLPPPGKGKALHRDDDPTNFVPENLYWGDAFDNAQDAIRNGGMARGERHGSRTNPEKFGKLRIQHLGD